MKLFRIFFFFFLRNEKWRQNVLREFYEIIPIFFFAF